MPAYDLDIPPGMYASVYDDPAHYCQCTLCHAIRAFTANPRIYDRDGYDQFGYDRAGRDRFGFTHLQRYGYDVDGYNIAGYDRDGWNEDGRDEDGYDRDGRDEDGYDRDGRDEYGYNSEGYDNDGYDIDGYNEDGYNSRGYDRSGYDRDGYDSDGYDIDGDYYDSDSDSDGEGLHAYDYVPSSGFDFHGDGPTFYGLEIEVTSDNDYGTLQTARDHLGSLGFLKQDGSVAGFEMVTHPMSYDYAMANFPWHMLPALRREGCRARPMDNGIHVHVSRDGFSNGSHLYRWMKLIYRNQRNVQHVARRSTNEWAAFDDDCRKGQATHAKYKGADYRRGMMINDATKATRYNAINTTNTATLEVRIFASTLDIEEAQSALQLVAATVEYTRGLTAHEITAGDGWSWTAFTAWLGEHSATYSALARYLDVYRELATA